MPKKRTSNRKIIRLNINCTFLNLLYITLLFSTTNQIGLRFTLLSHSVKAHLLGYRKDWESDRLIIFNQLRINSTGANKNSKAFERGFQISWLRHSNFLFDFIAGGTKSEKFRLAWEENKRSVENIEIEEIRGKKIQQICGNNPHSMLSQHHLQLISF